MSKIDIIHTPCKSCVFAEYDGKTQISCFADQIEKYKNIGIEILEAYDDTKEFFIINKKKCLFFRDQSWYDKKELCDIKEATSLVKKENEMKYIAVIYLEPQTEQKEFEDILTSLKNQIIPPKGIMIIRDRWLTYKLSITQLSKSLNDNSIPWRLQNFIDNEMSFNDKIKAIVKSAPIDRFYYLIYPSKYKDYNFAETIDRYIQNGYSFGCININNNLFFSYLTLNYIKNLNNIDLLTEYSTHTQYEKIN